MIYLGKKIIEICIFRQVGLLIIQMYIFLCIINLLVLGMCADQFLRPADTKINIPIIIASYFIAYVYRLVQLPLLLLMRLTYNYRYLHNKKRWTLIRRDLGRDWQESIYIYCNHTLLESLSTAVGLKDFFCAYIFLCCLFW